MVEVQAFDGIFKQCIFLTHVYGGRKQWPCHYNQMQLGGSYCMYLLYVRHNENCGEKSNSAQNGLSWERSLAWVLSHHLEKRYSSSLIGLYLASKILMEWRVNITILGHPSFTAQIHVLCSSYSTVYCGLNVINHQKKWYFQAAICEICKSQLSRAEAHVFSAKEHHEFLLNPPVFFTTKNLI